jgi:hypothetical protein
MSIQLTKIGNSPNVPVKEFICDTQADVDALPASAPMGSTAFCIGTKKAYMKGSDGWQEI